MAKKRIIQYLNCSPFDFHKKSEQFTRATAQSAALENILPIMTEEEEMTFRRGRNAKGRRPPNVSIRDYRRATGMECLFGYLFLTDKTDRVEELFEIAYESIINLLKNVKIS